MTRVACGVLAWLALGLSIAACACAPPRRAGVGTECELASECAAPLVCRLGYCRNQCATSADCPTRTSCVLDQGGFGACQLDAERSCSLASECPEGLACRLNQCTNACETERDCVGGARCEMTAMGLGCIDPSVEACTYDAECDPLNTGVRCIDGRCRRECYTDRDCRNDYWCGAGSCRPLPRGGADAPTPVMGMPLGPVRLLTAGGAHGCALTTDARLFCWGLGAARGTTVASLIATEVALPAPIDPATINTLASSSETTCLLAGSDAYCFGGNRFGELGRGPAGMDGGLMEDTMPALAFRGARTLIGAPGHFHFLAFSAAVGNWQGWGEDFYGGLGTGGSMVNRGMATPSTNLNGATLVGTGFASCGTFLPTGGVRCFGRVFGTSMAGELMPTMAPTGIDGVAVGGTAEFICAHDGSEVYCTGDNARGTLGDGTTVSRDEWRPISAPLPASIMRLVAGSTHVCALLSNAEVYCWGSSAAFVAGAGPLENATNATLAASGATDVVCGDTFTCVLRTDSRVECLGSDASHLGIGTTVPATDFTEVRR